MRANIQQVEFLEARPAKKDPERGTGAAAAFKRWKSFGSVKKQLKLSLSLSFFPYVNLSFSHSDEPGDSNTLFNEIFLFVEIKIVL